MKKMMLGFLLLAILPFVFTAKAKAQDTNNRFGIHIFDENDLSDAAALVNSNGGSWGYVAMVIREDERDIARWSRVFTKMKSLKLIPIIRIATTIDGENWRKPDIYQAKPWAIFLDSLPWPTKKRYVQLFNEPNHAKEWGGSTNPSEYTKIARKYWEELNRRSFDFFVLPAGFDQAAPNSSSTMDEAKFLDEMYQSDPLIFTIFDGWASHSYPNPGFLGSPTDTGRGTIKGYEWETLYLQKYNLRQNIPIFITETGWVYTSRTKDKIDDWYRIAFENVWDDPKIQAVTPFLLSYNSPPFNVFSWKNPATGQFYSQYNVIKSIPKSAGEPELAPEKEAPKYPVYLATTAPSPRPTEPPVSQISQIVMNFTRLIDRVLLRIGIRRY